MVTGERDSLAQLLYYMRQDPSEPYKEAVYHSSLQYVTGRPWGSSCRKQWKSKFPSLQQTTKEWKVSPRASRASSEAGSSIHLELPEQIPPSLAILPASSRSRRSIPSQSDVTPPSSDVTLPSMPSSSLEKSDVLQQSSLQSVHQTSAKQGRSTIASTSIPSRSNSKASAGSRSNKPMSASSTASSRGNAPRENALRECNGELENGSISGSEASTVVQSSAETCQSLAELQQCITDIKEDNTTLTANLQNLRDLVEQQTANFQKREEETRGFGNLEQQLKEIQERIVQQGQQLAGMKASGSNIESRISGLEDTEGQLGNQMGELETRLVGRISCLEETWGQYGGIEDRLGGRISALEESRSQAQAMEAKLTGRIDALEQHLRATNTTGDL